MSSWAPDPEKVRCTFPPRVDRTKPAPAIAPLGRTVTRVAARASIPSVTDDTV